MLNYQKNDNTNIHTNTAIGKPQAEPLHVLFVLPFGIDSNSGFHVQSLIEGLQPFKTECAVAVPKGYETQAACNLGSTLILSYHHIIKQGFTWPDGSEPDIIHAWTPREKVRKFVKLYTENRPCPVVIHLEDNEVYLTESQTGFSYQELLDMPTAKLDNLVPNDRYHPLQGEMWLKEANGLTMITGTLEHYNFGNKPALIIQPPPDERLFFHRPINYQLRKKLNIPAGNIVLTYNGNVHKGNHSEVLQLYRAVKKLNDQGKPTTLIRTGNDSVPLDNNDCSWIKSFEKHMGWVNRKDIPAIIAAADILVQPGNPGSFNDARIPCKLPEYFAIGRPVVLPRTNLGLHLIHGDSAWVLDSADANSIAAAVENIHAGKELYQKLAVGALAYYAHNLADSTYFRQLNNFYRSIVATDKPIIKAIAPKQQTTPPEKPAKQEKIIKPSPKPNMRLLFVLPDSMDSKYGYQVALLTRRMHALGVESVVAVPDQNSPAKKHNNCHTVLSYSELLQKGIPFTGQTGPDLIHAWTPREIVRRLVESFTAKQNCPLIIHLDNNEEYLTESYTGIPFHKLEKLPLEKLDSLIPEYCYHPIRGRDMLKNANSITMTVDSLEKYNYNNLPAFSLPPQVDERYFYPRPMNYKVRRQLKIPDNHLVLVYPGNVNITNRDEVLQIYKAVQMLNKKGCPTTLIRTGINYVTLDKNGTPRVKPFEINLGWVEHDKLPDIIAAANILVQPGKADSNNDYRIPYKIPGFLALGRPIIMPKTNLGLLLENEKEALVFNEVNAEAITSAVIKINHDKSYAGKLAAGAASFYRSRMLETKNAQKLFSFYQASLETPAGYVCTV